MLTFPHESSGHRIHAGAGLVQKHNARLANGGHGHAEFALVAARQAAGGLVFEVLEVQLHLLEK